MQKVHVCVWGGGESMIPFPPPMHTGPESMSCYIMSCFYQCLKYEKFNTDHSITAHCQWQHIEAHSANRSTLNYIIRNFKLDNRKFGCICALIRMHYLGFISLDRPSSEFITAQHGFYHCPHLVYHCPFGQ